jgi:hypothetical protein
MPHATVEARREYRRRWYANLSTDRKQAMARANHARHTSVKQWIAEYKLRVGCADCGYKDHHAALDFDHVRGDKTINVCTAKSIAQAKAEIAKCEVVCANCHRIRSYERMVYPCKPDIFAATYEPAE